MAELIRRSEPLLARWDPLEMVRDLAAWDPFQRLDVGARTFTPSLEICETPNAFVFRADLPGVKEEDLDISVTGNRLTISGKREEEQREEGEQFYAVERSFGSFSRTFALPEGCDLDHVEAELKNGVLTVVIPKGEQAKAKRISLEGFKQGVKESVKEIKEKVAEIKEKVSEKLHS